MSTYGLAWWPRQDSNLDLEFRKLPFYPLNYRALSKRAHKATKNDSLRVRGCIGLAVDVFFDELFGLLPFVERFV